MKKKMPRHQVENFRTRQNRFIIQDEKAEIVEPVKTRDPENALVVDLGDGEFQIVDRYGVDERGEMIKMGAELVCNENVQWQDEAQRIGVMAYKF